MSKADELFDELFYEKIHDNKRRIVYKFGVFDKIEFDIKNKHINHNLGFMDMKILKAINEKCKELGVVR